MRVSAGLRKRCGHRLGHRSEPDLPARAAQENEVGSLRVMASDFVYRSCLNDSRVPMRTVHARSFFIKRSVLRKGLMDLFPSMCCRIEIVAGAVQSSDR